MIQRLSVQTLSRLALALVACTYSLVVLGSAVRAHEAGLACPDWPLCFGEVIPAIDVGVAFEFGHRVLAGGISLLFLGLVIVVLSRADLRRRVGALVGIASVVLVIQIILGGLTVLELLARWTVTSHLMTGNTFCLLLFTIALTLREMAHPVERTPLGNWAKVAGAAIALALAAQLALGGLVSSSHAGLACGTWPSCNGNGWFPTFEGLVGLQVMHRITGYTVFAVALGVLAASRGQGRFGRTAAVIGVMVVAQIGLGIANVLFYLPPEVTILHSAGAAALVLMVTFLNLEAWRAPAPAAISAANGATLTAREAR